MSKYKVRQKCKKIYPKPPSRVKEGLKRLSSMRLLLERKKRIHKTESRERRMAAWQKMRKFLKKFLKVNFVTGVVGICTVWVAISANNIATTANETAKLQAMIAKNAEEPTIEVVRSLYTVEQQEKNNFNVDVSILDGKYSSYKSETVTFLEFDFRDGRFHDGISLSKFEMPLLNYVEQERTSALYGKIETWTSENWAKQLGAFRENCEAWFEELKQNDPEIIQKFSFPEIICGSIRDDLEVDGQVFEKPASKAVGLAAEEIPSVIEKDVVLKTSIRTYLKITYLNLLGEEELAYYVIDSDTAEPYRQINVERGERQFSKHAQMIDAVMWPMISEKNSNTPSTVFKIIEEIGQAGDLYRDIDELK